MSAKTATLITKPKREPTPQERGRRAPSGRFASTAAATPATPPPADEPEDELEAESEQLDDEVTEEPITPTRLVGGLKVVDTEPVFTGLKVRAGQPRIALKNTVLLVLEDGSKVFSCVDCDFTDAGRGVVMRHRGDVHGQNLGGWGSRRTNKSEGTPIGDKPAMGMTLGDVLELGSKLDAYAVIIERQEERLAELRERAEVAERRLRVTATRLEKAGLCWISED